MAPPTGMSAHQSHQCRRAMGDHAKTASMAGPRTTHLPP